MMKVPSRPLVSVVVPVHGPSPYLEAALASISRQSFSDFEVIVVDERAAAGLHARVKAVIPNARIVKAGRIGPAAARNAGTAAALGRWVAYLDADDVWLERKLTRQMEQVRANPSIKVVGCAFVEADNEGAAMLRPRRRKFREGDALESVMLDDLIIPSTALCDREAVLDVGGWRNAGQFEDTLFFGALACRYPFSFLDVPLVLYRRHLTNRSKSHQHGRLEAFVGLVHALRRQGCSISRALERRIHAHGHVITSHWHRDAGRRGRAACSAAQAILADPMDPRHYGVLLRLALPAIVERNLKKRVGYLAARNRGYTTEDIVKRFDASS